MSRAAVAAVAELEAEVPHKLVAVLKDQLGLVGSAEDVVTQAAKEVGIEVASRRLREVAAECIDVLGADVGVDDVEPNDDLEPPLTSGPTSDRADGQKVERQTFNDDFGGFASMPLQPPAPAPALTAEMFGCFAVPKAEAPAPAPAPPPDPFGYDPFAVPKDDLLHGLMAPALAPPRHPSFDRKKNEIMSMFSGAGAPTGLLQPPPVGFGGMGDGDNPYEEVADVLKIHEEERRELSRPSA